MSAVLTNRFLFSHHYLERICQEADDRTEAAQLIADLKGWAGGWDDTSLPSVMSTQVQPTLVSLGFNYREPSEGEDPHLLRLYTSYRQENQVGLCYVAHRQEGETDLDSTVKGRHYAAELIHAVKEKELSWGLLTDGERWRLYNGDELARYETFLEIDLGGVLKGTASAAKEDAGYLLQTFFTESAFEPDEDGECALDRHLSGSEEEASTIEKHLSKCIEDVLRDLCQGFVERDGRETYTSDQRDDVFRNATVLLYRLLFILYAEARDLLPLEVPEYHAASLDALVELAAQYVKVSGLPNPDGTKLWQNLSDLCSWINSGDEDHYIPAYNGDLFDDSDKRYIHDHTIADKYLAPALFSLGAIEDSSKSGYRRIDYRDLSVRHLGSIYEGLLEYKLFIAQERRVRRSDGKGGYTFPKLSETRLKKGEEDQVIEVGEVYFADSAGERKAMGVYYTPEYIVDYIVQKTVRRGLEERRASLEEQLAGWLEEVETAPPGERQRLQQVVDQKLLDFVEQEVLTFRVCDPAMGSGHFLVNAVHTITTFIVETLNLTPWENTEIDSDPVKWRRRVAKRCLYGVDLNALAVELAKLSLWLSTAAKGKPLSFLDHHLRHGNSLIGTRLEDLIELLDERTDKEEERLSAGQMSMFDQYPEFRAPLKEAVDLAQNISVRIADVAEDVESQAADYEQVQRELKPYRDLADLITAQRFGLDVDEDRVGVIAHCLLESKSGLSEEDAELVNQAHELAQERSFFHWDLEFPEVFLEVERTAAKETEGVDVAAGNPPYGAELDSLEKQFVSQRFSRSSTSNTAEYFLELADTLVKPGGYVSMILPKSMAFYTSWRGMRTYTVEERTITHLLDVGVAFENVNYEQLVLALRKDTPSLQSSTRVSGAVPMRQFHRHKAIRLLGQVRQDLMDQEGVFIFRPIRPVEEAIIRKVLRASRRLGSLAKDIFRGLYIPNRVKASLKPGAYTFLESVPDVSRYEVRRTMQIDLPSKAMQEEAEKIMVPRIFLKVLRGNRLVAHYDSQGKLLTTEKLVNVVLDPDTQYRLPMIVAVINSPVPSFYLQKMLFSGTTETARVMDEPYSSPIPIPQIQFTTQKNERERLAAIGQELHTRCVSEGTLEPLARFVDDSLRVPSYEGFDEPNEGHLDVAHDLLAYLAQQMVKSGEDLQTLREEVDLFRFVDRGLTVVRLEAALIVGDDQRVDERMDLTTVRHDIDGLRLIRDADGIWTLEIQAKFRDPDKGWQGWIKEEDGYMIKRQWVPAYRLRLSEEKARFYRFALPRLQDFDNASSFPGGYTRSTLKKLHLTKVPMMPDVDLSELARLDLELSETRRKIELTDDLIDQIVYKLYGLTEEEIAIVENRA